MQFSSLYGRMLDVELGNADSTILFTTEQRKAALNEAQLEFADATECLKREATVTIAGGTAEYDLNSSLVIPGEDFAKLAKEHVVFRYTDAAGQVTVLAGDDLELKDITWLDRYASGWRTSTVASTTMQLPRYYYERIDGGHRYLGFTPVPSTGSSATATATVPYLPNPVTLTSDTQEPFTVDGIVRRDLVLFHHALPKYAAGRLELLRRDAEASKAKLAEFAGYISRWISRMRQKGGKQVQFTIRPFRTSRMSDRGTDPRR